METKEFNFETKVFNFFSSGGGGALFSLVQFCSSLISMQSGCPSQRHALEMHLLSPPGHRSGVCAGHPLTVELSMCIEP